MPGGGRVYRINKGTKSEMHLSTGACLSSRCSIVIANTLDLWIACGFDVLAREGSYMPFIQRLFQLPRILQIYIALLMGWTLFGVVSQLTVASFSGAAALLLLNIAVLIGLTYKSQILRMLWLIANWLITVLIGYGLCIAIFSGKTIPGHFLLEGVCPLLFSMFSVCVLGSNSVRTCFGVSKASK